VLCNIIGNIISTPSLVHFTHRVITVIFCPQDCYFVFYVSKDAWNIHSLMFWTRHAHSFMGLSFLLYYYLRRSTPLRKLLKIVTVIRTLFQLIAQTIIVVCHCPAIFIVFRGVSLHISASESISGYGCRVQSSVLDWHQLKIFFCSCVSFPFQNIH
jgi:succinate dehydrogenase hydrophobic anchor subunit